MEARAHLVAALKKKQKMCQIKTSTCRRPLLLAESLKHMFLMDSLRDETSSHCSGM